MCKLCALASGNLLLLTKTRKMASPFSELKTDMYLTIGMQSGIENELCELRLRLNVRKAEYFNLSVRAWVESPRLSRNCFLQWCRFTVVEVIFAGMALNYLWASVQSFQIVPFVFLGASITSPGNTRRSFTRKMRFEMYFKHGFSWPCSILGEILSHPYNTNFFSPCVDLLKLHAL